MDRLTITLERLSSLSELLCGRLRAKLLALRGATVAEKVTIGAYCRVDRPWGLKFGKRFVAEDLVYLKLVEDRAALTFGEYVFVGRGSEFDVMDSVTVGDHTVIAPGCFITDHNHGIATDRRIDEQPCISKPVIIGKDVWLGTKVVVLAGVEIGDGAVVAANAVVTKSVPPKAVVAGTPARFLYSRDDRMQPMDKPKAEKGTA